MRISNRSQGFRLRTRVPAGLLAFVLSWLSPATALGHYPEWASSNESVAVWTGYTTITTGDTLAARSQLLWDNTRRTNLLHAASHGARFTIDAKDNSANLNATGSAWTQLPAPYYDSDNDTGADRKWEEAEITAEATPNANTWYTTYLYFMRWWKSCPTCAYANWDPDSGTITHTEQLSAQVCCGDKWNTVVCCANLGTNSYPYQARPASASSAAEPLEPLSAQSADLRPARSARAKFNLVPTADPDELRVDPDLSRGLDAYVTAAESLSRELVSLGPSQGIVTFNRPVMPADVERLRALGLTIQQVEAVSEEVDGLRTTAFAAYSASFGQTLDALFAEAGSAMLGITAATVEVSSADVLTRAEADPDVYVVDLALEQARRANKGTHDFVMNDLYWRLAGWVDG